MKGKRQKSITEANYCFISSRTAQHMIKEENDDQPKSFRQTVTWSFIIPGFLAVFGCRGQVVRKILWLAGSSPSSCSGKLQKKVTRGVREANERTQLKAA